MDTSLESSRKFKDKTLKSFSHSSITKRWSKAEIQAKITGLWTELLEEELTKRKEK